MSPPPPNLAIYHITHVANLGPIAAAGQLVCDAAIEARDVRVTTIGLARLKQSRLMRPVTCFPGDFVGEYVPFYFCPRSVMLFVISRRTHAELAYRDGQEPIVHLEADLRRVLDWAFQNRRRWAFSLSNASAHHTEFRASTAALGEIDWASVASRDFRDPAVKAAKQAEFLVRWSFPWHLIQRIGVRSPGLRDHVAAILASGRHRPRIDVRPDWYY